MLRRTKEEIHDFFCQTSVKTTNIPPQFRVTILGIFPLVNLQYFVTIVAHSVLIKDYWNYFSRQRSRLLAINARERFYKIVTICDYLRLFATT